MREGRFNAEGCFIAAVAFLLVVLLAIVTLAAGAFVLILLSNYVPEFSIVFPSIVIDEAMFKPLVGLLPALLGQTSVAIFIAMGVSMLNDPLIGKDVFIRVTGWGTIVGAIVISSIVYTGAFNG